MMQLARSAVAAVRPALALLGWVLLTLAGWAAPASATAELIYVHEPGCPYCRKWEREVGPAYSNSEEGRRAPLRAVHIRDLSGAGLALLRPARYTPTFILVENGIEIGRIEGYPGEDHFWGLLDRLIEKLDPPVHQPSPAAPSATRTRLSIE